jgi:hypothetical protein
MMAFGKRNTQPGPVAFASTPRPRPDADGVTRITPKELFDNPETAELYRRIGLTADSPENIVKTSQDHQAIADRCEGERSAFFARLNREFGHEVGPWPQIPYSCWQGPHARMLLGTLDMYPAQAFNVLVLPRDEAGAQVYQLPRHPGAVPAGFVELVNAGLEQIESKIREAHKQAMEASARGDNTLVFGFSSVVEAGRRSVSNLANLASIELFGTTAVARSRELFFGEKRG